ncbi:MAG TPA: hypothetical protein V6C65_24175 [Allocoleopsis sp.]
MATITISNLQPSGYAFFSDAESYLTDLSDTELGVQGGISPTPAIAASSEACGILAAAAICEIADWLF